jgi:hypothetical protein
LTFCSFSAVNDDDGKIPRRKIGSSFHELIKPYIIIKPGPGVDPAKGPGLGIYGLTRMNPEIRSFFFLLKLLTTASTPKKINIPTTL